jgi:hypothetical protein
MLAVNLSEDPMKNQMNHASASSLRAWTLPILVVLSFSLSGCLALVAGAGAGAAGAVYVKGKLEDEVQAPVPAVHQATVMALKELNMPIVVDRADSLTGEIKSKLADGKDVTIELERETQKTTKVGIRVGMVGDEKQSLEILDQIKKHLPGEAAA